VAPPDFVGIGAGKSGTSWWYKLLQRHPSMFHPEFAHKERTFLTAEFVEREPVEADRLRYAGWFARPPGLLAGEWSPWYLFHPWFGRVVRELAPEARLLVILRDPVERFRSDSSMTRTRRGPGIRTDEIMVRRGLYASWLAALEPHVERSQLLVLQYERCVASPQAELDRTFAFLGLDPVTVEDAGAPVNATRVDKGLLPAGRHDALVDLYRDDVEALAARYPEIDLDLWPSFAAGARSRSRS
jgi:hypothetical protein